MTSLREAVKANSAATKNPLAISRTSIQKSAPTFTISAPES
jgi:hypothetical protein